MSKRTSIIDDKSISEMILNNIATASQMNIEMSDILNNQQMRMLSAYKETYNYQPYLSFFLSLGIMSHFSQNSYYTHYASPDHCPVQLYLWLLGSSGSGKTHALRQVEKAITKVEKMFPETYLKPVAICGKPSELDLSSVVTHTNHIGLRQHLASNHKILLNDDADLFAENYGLYNANDGTKEHERNLILCGYDGFGNSSRTTGTTWIHIDDKRLTILIAITGGKLMKNMKNWLNYTGFDGSHNRFLYMAIPKLVYARPQNFRINKDAKTNQSLTHLSIIAHLFGKVRYVFQMTQSERKTFCGAVFNESPNPVLEEEQNQTQQDRSAMFTLWNLIADLIETNDQKENQQQQILDFYGKAGATFPRIACLMQLYFNATRILEQVQESVVFAEGDNNDLIINDNFVISVENIIKKDYYIYDRTYLPCNENAQTSMDPMIIVEKEAVVAAWKWYDHHLNIATKLFTIDHDFTSKPVTISSSIPSRRKTLKQLIMLLDFNIFPLSTITDKHPITGQTGILKNRPALGERAIQELMSDNLLKFNYFLTDVRGRVVKSYMKMPIPSLNDHAYEIFLNNLIKHDINIDEYMSTYNKSSIPPANKLSPLTLEIMESNASFVTQYIKYKNYTHTIIQKHIENHCIQEIENGNLVIINRAIFLHEFYEIENLILNSRQEKSNNRSQSRNSVATDLVRHTTESVPLENATTFRRSFVSSTVNKEQEPQHHHLRELSINRQDLGVYEKSVVEKQPPLEDIDDLSSTIDEKQSDIDEIPDYTNADEQCSNTSIQQNTTEKAKTSDTKTEEIVKKAMRNIITNRSVLFTKTDLTQICNKTVIRTEAVQRLITINLLQHGTIFWIEPNRSKKESTKVLKRIVREGWLKKGPESQTDASRFQFIKILQENVNLTYDEYLKTFYPCQGENVFTNNNWTLSEELMEILQTNFFYKQHVRWNHQRFGPFHVRTHGEGVEVERDSTSVQLSHSHHSMNRTAIDDVAPMLSELPNSNNKEQEEDEETIDVDYDDKDETAHPSSAPTRPKRKAAPSENFYGHHTRTQIRKKRKN